ncbi:uncharacterized protein [Montipora foliosa]|uniref:uncharacterized protein isoform X1 n=2 Tax=Montipora foliosa TaxID=591990 RepID=UPI0035F0FCD1
MNMVLRQCLACNAAMSEACQSCVCGHVFEDAKQIGGKRFSEYRARLYTRLENKRQKQLTRQKRKLPEDSEAKPQPLKERKTNIEENIIPTPDMKPMTLSLGPKRFHRRIKGKRIPRQIKAASSGAAIVPPELASRLPNALQEINRRLTGQNLMWWIMKLQ